MRLLLDTHVVLWAAQTPHLLHPAALTAISDGANDIRLSVVTAWEIAVKQSLGKLNLSIPVETFIPAFLKKTGVVVASVGLDDAMRVRGLPFHHRDPFDRLLIAQALEGGYTVVTRDRWFASYGVPVLQA